MTSRVRRVFSSVLFWFLITLLFYIYLLSNNFLFCTEKIWWDDFYHISSSFLTGGLISFLFYFLVVHLPKRNKCRIMKDNFRQCYLDVKKEILYQIIFASQEGGRKDLQADSETVERLLTIDGFQAAFEGGDEADTGIYAFMNQVSKGGDQYQEIILNLRILAKQISYVLHNYPITNAETFNFFTHLEAVLTNLESSTPGYDQTKYLTDFIGKVYKGFSFIEGHRGYDIIEKRIEEI